NDPIGLQNEIEQVSAQLLSLEDGASAQCLFLKARSLQRRLALANPLLDFDGILFTKHVPGTFNHRSDQYYGGWSRPGGGIYLLRNFKSDAPTTECLTTSFQQAGSFL